MQRKIGHNLQINAKIFKCFMENYSGDQVFKDKNKDKEQHFLE